MFANTPRCSWTIDMVGPETLDCPKLAKKYFFLLPNEHSHFFDFEETKPPLPISSKLLSVERD